MKLASSEAVRRIDAAAIERFGVPGAALMETAGAAAAQELLRRWPRSARRGVLVLCGKGNNGGDGFVVARHLAAAGIEVALILLGAAGAKDLSGDARTMAQAWVSSGGEVATGHEAIARVVERAGVVVDALLGTGIHAAPHGEIAQGIEALQRACAEMGATRPKVLSLDVPSGVNASTGEVPGAAVLADVTVTFGMAKLGLFTHPGARNAGRVRVAPLGWPRAALDAEDVRDETLEARAMRALVPPLDVEAHKGTRGRVLVVAGRDERPGAAALAAHAAFRAGAGLVVVATTERAAADVVAAVPEAMPDVLPSANGEVAASAAKKLLSLAENADAIVVGPALGTGAGPAAVLRALLAEKGAPAVVDADALTLFAAEAKLRGVREIVLTPHPGEAGRLLGVTTAEIQSSRALRARDLAARFGAVAVLKGARSLVADPAGALAVNLSGNPGLATAGAGDVLSGILAAFLGRGIPTRDAARAAVWVHGAAADACRVDLGGAGFLARDVADRVPRALMEPLP